MVDAIVSERSLRRKTELQTISEWFEDAPGIIGTLKESAGKQAQHIKELLYASPAFFEMVKATVPEKEFVAMLSDEQKSQLAEGVVKLMCNKKGNLMASLVNPNTKKIVSNIPLAEKNFSPDIARSLSNISMQMQLAEIAEQMRNIREIVEEIRIGQENDRLATAYSVEQKLLQAMDVENPELRKMLLIGIVTTAEDSRNLLMLSQRENVKYIMSQPTNIFKKFASKTTTEDIDNRVGLIRDGLAATNMVSLAQAIAYQNLGEEKAARRSLEYYKSFIEDIYLDDEVAQRLNQRDPSLENYWTEGLPRMVGKIEALPCFSNE